MEVQPIDSILKDHFLHFLEYLCFTYSPLLHTIFQESQSALNLLLDQTSIPIEKLSTRDWSLILACPTLINKEKDSTILEEGYLNDRLYKLKTGKARVEKKIETNGIVESKTLAYLDVNDVCLLFFLLNKVP